MARPLARRARAGKAGLPEWIRPQLTELVDQPPDGPEWLHEIKFDGYRMHARIDRGVVRLLTRTGLDWTHKYPPIAAAVASARGRPDLSRRRAVRGPTRRHHLLQHDPGGVGLRQRRGARAPSVRSSVPRRRTSARAAAD